MKPTFVNLGDEYQLFTNPNNVITLYKISLIKDTQTSEKSYSIIIGFYRNHNIRINGIIIENGVVSFIPEVLYNILVTLFKCDVNFIGAESFDLMSKIILYSKEKYYKSIGVM